MNVSFNELVLGIVSKSLKQHFNSKGDKTRYISLALPHSFNELSENRGADGNQSTACTIYLDLEENIN